MYKDTLHTLNSQAKKKYGLLQHSPIRYLFGAILAGAYVGIGSLVLFAVGQPLYDAGSPFVSIMTGATFGVALALVLWAGSELFTGNNMIFTVSSLSKITSWRQTLLIWGWSYIGNLIGALALSLLVLVSGIFASVGPDDYMMSLASDKMNAPMMELFFRGILCNWIVCLAIWTSLRAEGDIAKLFLIFILIFAFIAAGFEHSVANMSLLGMALMHGGSETVTLNGFFHNLIPVSLGNIIGGGVFVASIYYFISYTKKEYQEEHFDKKSS
ncbi:formate/nitrite transporter family protein [Shouchella lehensis]|uniref:Transporter protein n=2 Tax=Shouchella lehensis TaxID=300825 RepID=A0A060M0Y9_9BACI|nr:formate/nitrite transporter family protein [Shouchella lehensis]AIC95695.1 transporter protein [Shouchella lehensis G1]MBG9783613.1 nitrite transporter NirC [Shouchella lehensis]TES51438.1 formate/nitrite transporter family protein [Shouchella lehensis]